MFGYLLTLLTFLGRRIDQYPWMTLANLMQLDVSLNLERIILIWEVVCSEVKATTTTAAEPAGSAMIRR